MSDLQVAWLSRVQYVAICRSKQDHVHFMNISVNNTVCLQTRL